MKKYLLFIAFALSLIACSVYHKTETIQSTSAAATDYSLRVMSYNVRHCSPPATGLIDVASTAAAILNKSRIW